MDTGRARADGLRLLALPEAALGGYLTDLGGTAEGPPWADDCVGKRGDSLGDLTSMAAFLNEATTHQHSQG